MGILRRKSTIITEENERTPIKFKKRGELLSLDDRKKKRKRIKRIFLLCLFFIILSAGGYFGTKAYLVAKKIFAEGSGEGILSLWNHDQGQVLRGENTGRTNVLLLGVGDEGHDGATLSDTMIILSLDVREKNVAMFSIPRDLYVQIPKHGYAKINSAHAYGEQEKYSGGGMTLARETIEKTFAIYSIGSPETIANGLSITIGELKPETL